MSRRPDAPSATAWFQLARFAVAVLLLTIVFYLAGPILGSLRWLTNSNLPVAAVAVVCPAIAALVLSRRERSLRGLKSRLALNTVAWQTWIFAALALPATVFAASALTGFRAFTAPTALGAGLIAIVYLVGALAEEIGWTGYALPRLLMVRGELASGLILGTFWAAWHIILYAEAGNDPMWIVGQCLFSIALRLLLVRISVAARLSIWPAVICHATYNLAWSLSPDGGAHYNPWVVACLTTALVVVLYLGRWFVGRARLARND